MTSEKRSWYEGATYHITARGHHRNDIFRDEEDFKIYLIILEEELLYFNNYNYEIIAYCLMDNHVHLLLKTGVEPPWRFIARVHSIYARYFNKKYNYVGALFQGRYSADIIEDDTYMLETSRYIHLNLVKARMVEMKIVINLSPSDVKKSGSHFDLGMAIALLIQSAQIFVEEVERYAFIGELSLNGDLRPCIGV